jgi:nucleoside-diphosphate kinase
METTFGIIKPEAIERGLVKEIEKRIAGAGLRITSSRPALITEQEFELIYGKVDEPAWLHSARREYLTSKEVLLLKIEGDQAVKTLLAIRGYSNPIAAPGTIRGDFARDQDYAELRAQKKIALNMFHACDTEKEAQGLIDYFAL